MSRTGPVKPLKSNRTSRCEPSHHRNADCSPTLPHSVDLYLQLSAKIKSWYKSFQVILTTYVEFLWLVFLLEKKEKLLWQVQRWAALFNLLPLVVKKKRIPVGGVLIIKRLMFPNAGMKKRGIFRLIIPPIHVKRWLFFLRQFIWGGASHQEDFEMTNNNRK